jgi:hypothetical protein
VRARLIDRDGPVCWICGGEVDLDVPPTAPGAPTVDHVLPRARGGSSDPANLRLAHRRCNGRRGSRLPELDWPAQLRLRLLDAWPLWPVALRARRRPGTWENVAVAADAAGAGDAVAWAVAALTSVLPGEWEGRHLPAGSFRTVSVRLRRTDAGA